MQQSTIWSPSTVWIEKKFGSFVNLYFMQLMLKDFWCNSKQNVKDIENCYIQSCKFHSMHYIGVEIYKINKMGCLYATISLSLPPLLLSLQLEEFN